MSIKTTQASSKNKHLQTMKEVVNALGDKLVPIRQGSNIVGKIINISRSQITVDIDGIAIGIVPAREFSPTIFELKPGDEIKAYVLMQENEDGLVVLSLRRADKEQYQAKLAEHFNKKESFKVWVKDANRGGLMVAYGTIEGFLPASQLSSKNYPRGNAEQIIKQLKSLVNKELKVRVITFEPSENKFIFSEKAAGDELADELKNKFKVGTEVSGKITGIVNFGLFIDLGDIEGLVHISEIAWDRVLGQEDLERRFNIGDQIKAQVISNDGGRIALSIKRLTPDPWQKDIKRFKIGDVVSAKVIKIVPYGAFIQLTDNVVGLMHISEFDANSPEGWEQEVVVGATDKFKIIDIDTKERKVTLAKPESLDKD